MLTGPLTRTRAVQKRYMAYIDAKSDTKCDFCAFQSGQDQVIAEYNRFFVVKNLFSYDIWDGVDVIDHIMVVPKRHIDSVGHFKADESKEYMAILADYESQNYSFYARAPKNIAKSVVHQHTHLIKLGTKYQKALVYVRKPHIVRYF